MSPNKSFRDTILPNQMPNLSGLESPVREQLDEQLKYLPHLDTKDRTASSPADNLEQRSAPKGKNVLSVAKDHHLQSPPVPPKIVKLLVEKIDSEDSNVLTIGGQRYDKIQVVNQAGQGVLSMEDSDAFPLVLVKERKHNSRTLKPLKPCFHDNIIALRTIFYHTDSVSTVYEYEMGAMTLAAVASCPSVVFSDADIATVSRDILYALQFIHSELKIAHGDVRDSNVMLTLSGGVKLANLGDSMLNDVTLKDRDRDLKAIGTVAMNVADRTTKIVRPDVAHWDSSASKILREFISRTSQEALKTLLKHEFLQLAGPSWSLKPHLTKALKFDPTFRGMVSLN